MDQRIGEVVGRSSSCLGNSEKQESNGLYAHSLIIYTIMGFSLVVLVHSNFMPRPR